MALTYTASRTAPSDQRKLFSSTEALVLVTDTSTSITDVIAVARDLTTAQAIATSLNGA